MSRVLCFLMCLLVAGCSSDDRDSDPATLKLGSWKCGKPPAEMLWLHALVQQMETDKSLSGDIYAGYAEGRIMFVHQPLIMSCLACIVYDCDGNRIDTATLDHEKIRLILKPQNRIYKAY